MREAVQVLRRALQLNNVARQRPLTSMERSELDGLRATGRSLDYNIKRKLNRLIARWCNWQHV